MIKVTKEDIIWASGHYLGTNLPSDYDEWEEEKIDLFLEDNACEYYQYADPKFIWEQIESLAWSMRHYIQEENKTNEFKNNVKKYMEDKR